jgi:hypothetical protein
VRWARASAVTAGCLVVVGGATVARDKEGAGPRVGFIHHYCCLLAGFDRRREDL